MSTTNGRTRERKLTAAEGVPMVDLSFARAERDRERVRLEWQHWGRMALMSLSLAAVMGGCETGTTPKKCETTAVHWIQTEQGPTALIMRACQPAKPEGGQ